ncbi:MAG: hypothetical protein EOO85_19475 [Pedobacter sp.]|nr:MAG: hypothetical protein EOO85_19475 [Pedobacter sp.]
MLQIKWDHPEKSDVFRWAVYYKYGNKWNYRILTRKDSSLDLLSEVTSANGKEKNSLTAYSVTAIDRTGNESDFVEYLTNPSK